MKRKPRGLRPDEEALWKQVAQTTTPLNDRPEPQIFEPPKPVRAKEPKQRPAVGNFAIGSRGKTQSAGHSFAPSVTERVSAKPLRMDKRAYGRLKRGKSKPESRLDLHGMTAAAAHMALRSFLMRSYSEEKRLVLVITGKGRRSEDDGPIPTRVGVLRHQLPDWLEQPPLNQIVLQVTQAHQSHGGSGAFYIYLARRR